MNMPLELILTSGEHQLAVVGMSGEEAISELYRFEIDVVCEAGQTLSVEVGPGADATLTFRRGDETLRQVHGVIASRRTPIDTQREVPLYRLVLVPHLVRATLVRTQQTFLNKTVVEIIQEKLALIGLGEDMVSVSQLTLANYPKREFVAQFEETDYAFISRLAEHLGVSFYFDQLADAEQLVFADDGGDFKPEAQAPSIQITDLLNQPERLYALDVVEPLLPGNYVAYDYNYRRPDLWLVGQQPIDEGHGGGVLEYGCHVKDEADAQRLAKIRGEELACRARRYHGESSIVNMVAGGVTMLEGSDAFEETELIVTRVRHELRTESGERGELRYQNRFDALETRVTFRPERKTPRPRISGFVTGTVQGPPGSTDAISPFLDPEGRYTVQFHWDAVLGDPAQRGSHLMRMAQPFGGTGHGMHFPLRPGTEVMIVFANGDPDRPIIGGAIPNAHTRTPVTASNATQNRITAASGAIFEISERR